MLQVSRCCCACRHLELGLQTFGQGLISRGLFKYWTINNKVVSYLYCKEESRILLMAEDKGNLASDFLAYASASLLVIHTSSPSPLTNQQQPSIFSFVTALCTSTYLYHSRSHHSTSYAMKPCLRLITAACKFILFHDHHQFSEKMHYKVRSSLRNIGL